MADYPYATPIEKAQLELLGRVADALDGIRFALVSKIIAPAPIKIPGPLPFNPPSSPMGDGSISTGGKLPNNPFRAPETHVRRVLTESETENPNSAGSLMRNKRIRNERSRRVKQIYLLVMAILHGSGMVFETTIP